MSLHHLLSQYGYAAVFALVAIESLGIPFPGETILITAAVYAGTTHRLSIWGVFAVAAAGAIIGDNVGFWIGDKGGYWLLHRYGHHVRADESKIKVGRYVADRHGPKVVFFARFVSLLRAYAAFLAGTLKMRWRKFLPYNVCGGIIWSATFAFAAYGLGADINDASGPVDSVFGVAVVVVMIAAIAVARDRAKRLTERAEAAYPDPLPEPQWSKLRT